jgi:hypothetical protein
MHNAGGERIRDEQRVFVGQRLHDDNSRRRELVVLVRRDLDLDGLFLAHLDRADDPAVQAADDRLLFQGRHADQHRNAIAEQRDDTVLAGAKRQRHGRQHVVAFEAGGLDPVAQQQRPHGNAARGR